MPLWIGESLFQSCILNSRQGVEVVVHEEIEDFTYWFHVETFEHHQLAFRSIPVDGLDVEFFTIGVVRHCALQKSVARRAYRVRRHLSASAEAYSIDNRMHCIVGSHLLRGGGLLGLSGRRQRRRAPCSPNKAYPLFYGV